MTTTTTRRRNEAVATPVVDDLILDNVGYVRHILNRLLTHLPPTVDSENLESAGIVGLIEAARQFDAGRDVEFRTFAYQRIRGSILDELRRNCPLSQQMLQKIAHLRRVREKQESSVTVEQLAAASEMSTGEVTDCIAASRLTRPESWSESLHGTAAEHVEAGDISEQREMREVLADGIEALPDTMRIAISLHYLEGLKLREIGTVLGLSESRVCRIVNNARQRLREFAERRCGIAS